MKEATYITILGWMRYLNLSLVERTVYAIIYGFSQDGDSTFHGSRQYLADWCGCTTKTIDAALRTLVDRDLITKREKFVSGIKFCEYSANFPTVEKISLPGKNTEIGGEKISDPKEKISHNNIDNNALTNVSAYSDNNAPARTREFDFKKALIDLGIAEQTASDWMAVRKNAKATNTQTAFNSLKTQIERICQRYDVTAEQVAAFAVSRDWKGINAGWDAVKNIKNANIGADTKPAVDPILGF